MALDSDHVYPSYDELQIIRAAERLMVEAMARYDPSHDAYHVQRVRKTALSLAKSVKHLNPDLLVVEVAALLHDVLDSKYTSSLSDQEREPLTFFAPFFKSVESHVDLTKTRQAELIVKVIENVSWSAEKKLRDSGKITPWHETCVELHCVQDADRLDAIGAFGVMRCSAYSTATGRPLHTPDDDSRQPESAIAHFHDKLLNVKERLKTEQGKKLGEERHKFMLEFLKAIDTELEY